METRRAFHGLFVGVDTYQDSAFRTLRYAKRDAEVLHALWWDNFHREPTLLVNAGATKENLLTEVGHLVMASRDDDVVMIAFSGHGTPTGELATHDTDPGRPAATAVRIAELVDLVDRIRARQLILALDCCFSGAAHEKTLRTAGQESRVLARNAEREEPEVLEALRKVSGSGRFFLTAAEGRAYEKDEYRHGILTHYVIEGLMGHMTSAGEEEVSLLDFAAHVVRMVGKTVTSADGTTQKPGSTLCTQDARFPRLRKGPRFEEVDGTEPPAPVTEELVTLIGQGIPDAVAGRWQERYGTLNELQVEAVNKGGVLAGHHALIAAPTASGKTLVGEIAALGTVTRGKAAVFLVPTRALVNQQYDDLMKSHPDHAHRIIRVTGELRDDIGALVSGNFDMAVCTYEKFIGLLFGHPNMLARIGTIVIDEIQSLVVRERGPLLEIMLTWIREQERLTDVPQIIGLSAVLGEPQELALWIGANLVVQERRKTPLIEGVVGSDGAYRYRNGSGGERTERLVNAVRPMDGDDELALRVVRWLEAKGHQVIVFRSTRRAAWTFAKLLADRLGLPAADDTKAELPVGDEGEWGVRLRDCLSGGVAFHTSALSDQGRRVVEQAFRKKDSTIRVVVATTTLAQGMDLPADSVVICELRHPDAKQTEYTVSEYKNMAGRAGRTGHVDEGRAIVLASGTADVEYKYGGYVAAKPEPVISRLLDTSADLRSSVLLALATRHKSRPVTQEDVKEFLGWTFAGQLLRLRLVPDEASDPFTDAKVEAAINNLVDAGLLARTVHEYSLTALGETAVRSGLSVESITTIAAALEAVSADGMTSMTLIGAAQLAKEMDGLQFGTGMRRDVKARGKAMEALAREGTDRSLFSRLMADGGQEGRALARARRGLACRLWSEGVPLARIESTITLQLGLPHAAPGPVQRAASRTGDIMSTVMEIAHQVNPSANYNGIPDGLATQLHRGVPAGLVPVVQYLEREVERSVFTELLQYEVRTAAAIARADGELLLQCCGGDRELVDQLRAAAERGEEAERLAAAEWV